MSKTDKLAKAARAALPKKIDLDDEDLVRAAMALELEVDPDDIEIEDSHLSSFRKGRALTVTIKGGGYKEWTVVQDDDVAEEIALAVVLQDINDDPGMFSQDFIESHIDTKRLRDELESDVLEMNSESLREMRESELEREAKQHGYDNEEFFDEDGNLREDKTDELIEAIAEDQTSQQLQDPMSYLADIYGKKDAVAQAIKIAGIDEKAAAKEAVKTDGWQHFLCRYDGNYDYAAGGLVYWQDN